MDDIETFEAEVRNFNVFDGDAIVRAILLVARILLGMWRSR